MPGKNRKKPGKAGGKGEAASGRDMRIIYGLVAVAGFIIIAVIWSFYLSPPTAKEGDTVGVYYTGTLDDGTVFDSNENASPLTFMLGQGSVIQGFEEAVAGMKINEIRTVKIPPEKAYGSYNSSLIRVLNRSALPANMTPVAGQYYSIRRSSDGAASVVRIINVTPGTVTWDENHELAGKNLTFTIRLATINGR